MSQPLNLKTEQIDMDSLFDFSQSTTQPSPATATASKIDATPRSAAQDWNAISPIEQEQRQQFSGPSHDYNQHRQQVGLPGGSLANIPPQSMYNGYGSGMGDMGFDSGFGGGWSSGIDIDLDADMSMDFNNPNSSMPAMFFPPPSNSNNNNDTFVDPNSIGGQEEPISNVGRLWPGMHSQQAQQAAMQKAAQVQAVQQRQLKLQAQQAQYRQQANGSQGASSSNQTRGHSKRPSHVSEPHVEESISRLLNQMRHSSNSGLVDDEDSPNGMLPQLARLKKDEEEMDEDERLLASEEGKKLSSKERRQLRNKVSARAFRSRRKEYIGQLEGEVAMKNQEAANLRNQNTALIQENDRYRGLIETLLRHPAFHPFVQDLSQDPSLLNTLQQPMQAPSQKPSATPVPQPQQQQSQQQQQQAPQQESKPDIMNFDASQLQIPSQNQQQGQGQNEQVGLAMIPENDFSKLNINGFNAINFNNFQRVNAFAVMDVPTPALDPVDLLLDESSTSAFASADIAGTEDMTSLLERLDGAARKCAGWD